MKNMGRKKEFLIWYKQQDLPRFEKPSVTADMVVYSFVQGRIKLLLIRRAAYILVNTNSPWSVVLLPKARKPTRPASVR